MNTPESIEIVNRFFEALYTLRDRCLIRGKQTFTDRYGINRWNLNTLQKNPASDIFQPAWLAYLVRDYGVSPMWLLTGEGGFFADGADTGRERKPRPQPQPGRRRGRPRKEDAL